MQKQTGISENSRTVLRVVIITIIANLIMTILKTVFGIVFLNLAVLSDAIHSASDLLTSVLVIVAIVLSNPKRDKKHNYGHEKVESLMVLLFSVILTAVGGGLIWQGIQGIISPRSSGINYYLIGVTALSLVVKEAMFWYTRHYSKKVKSDILKADAWHHRSDSLSSLAVLLGLASSFFMKTNIIENIAVIIVALLIFKVVFDITKPAIHQLTDRAVNDQTYNQIKEITMSVEGVKNVDSLHTRMFGNTIFVDIEIAVNGDLTTIQSHDIAQAVHDKLESDQDLRVKHCLVHINPFQTDM